MEDDYCASKIVGARKLEALIFYTLSKYRHSCINLAGFLTDCQSLAELFLVRYLLTEETQTQCRIFCPYVKNFLCTEKQMDIVCTAYQIVFNTVVDPRHYYYHSDAKLHITK